jgi:hypothetical protein
VPTRKTLHYFTMSRVRENRLFLGNPGAGKSTLINCLVGAPKLKSGSSWGGGLTQNYQRVDHDGVAYMDTPGLADETIAEQAAHAITTALKQGGTYKLFFLLRLQAGRLVSEDLVTLERVLESIDAGDLNYKFTIVMNSLSQREYQSLLERGEEFKIIKTLINRKYLTESFCFIPHIDELEDAADTVVKLPQGVYDFLDKEAPVITVGERQVKPIEVGGFATHAEEIKRELEELRRNHSELLRRMREQEELHDKAMKHMQASHEAQLHQLRGGTRTPGPAAAVPSPKSEPNYFSHPLTPPVGAPPTESGTSWFRRHRKWSVAALVALIVVIASVVVVVVATRNEPPPTPTPTPKTTPTSTPTSTPKSTTTNISKSSAPIPSPDGKSQFLGCLTDEAMMSTDKAYGDATKAYYSTALDQAEAKSKKYFALACRANYCHSFVFNKLLVNVTDFDGNDAGCKRLCPGSSAYYCGCSEGACEDAGVKPGGDKTRNRRWTVYERTSMTTTPPLLGVKYKAVGCMNVTLPSNSVTKTAAKANDIDEGYRFALANNQTYFVFDGPTSISAFKAQLQEPTVARDCKDTGRYVWKVIS